MAAAAEVRVFVHIPKTAGSTLGGILIREHGDNLARGGNFFSDPEACVARVRALAEGATAKGPVTITGHLPVSLRGELPSGARWFTLVRDPVERAISHCFFAVRSVDRDYLARFLERYLRASTIDNLQTRMLSGTPPNVPRCDESMLADAKANVRDLFELAGVTERFDDVVALLRPRLGWSSAAYVPAQVNPARPRREALASDAVGLLEACNALDMELYAYATALFERRIADERANLDAELARLRRDMEQTLVSACGADAGDTAGDGSRDLGRSRPAEEEIADLKLRLERMTEKNRRLRERNAALVARNAELEARRQ